MCSQLPTKNKMDPDYTILFCYGCSIGTCVLMLLWIKATHLHCVLYMIYCPWAEIHKVCPFPRVNSTLKLGLTSEGQGGGAMLVFLCQWLESIWFRSALFHLDHLLWQFTLYLHATDLLCSVHPVQFRANHSRIITQNSSTGISCIISMLLSWEG